jgi:hypothetical protein
LAINTSSSKKVKVFPFVGSFKFNQELFYGDILMMNQNGFMIEVRCSSLLVGQKVRFDFDLPVVNGRVAGEGIVMKTYNPAYSPSSGAANHRALIEIHFKSVAEVIRQKILDFVVTLPKLAA